MNPFLDMVRFTPNEKRYYQRSMAPTLVNILLMVAVVLVIEQFRGDWPFAALVAVALLPVLTIVWFFKLYIDYFRDCDEWEKLIEVYGICVGVLLVGTMYFAFGLLALFELVVLDGVWFALMMLPAISIAYVLGKIIGRWRHG